MKIQEYYNGKWNKCKVDISQAELIKKNAILVSVELEFEDDDGVVQPMFKDIKLEDVEWNWENNFG